MVGKKNCQIKTKTARSGVLFSFRINDEKVWKSTDDGCGFWSFYRHIRTLALSLYTKHQIFSTPRRLVVVNYPVSPARFDEHHLVRLHPYKPINDVKKRGITSPQHVNAAIPPSNQAIPPSNQDKFHGSLPDDF